MYLGTRGVRTVHTKVIYGAHGERIFVLRFYSTLARIRANDNVDLIMSSYDRCKIVEGIRNHYVPTEPNREYYVPSSS